MTVGNGDDTLTVGDQSKLLAGSGHDKITLGYQDKLGVSGSATSHDDITLGNNDIVAVSGGHVATHDTVGNDLVYLENTQAGSTVDFSNGDDVAFLGLNASAHIFLDPTSNDLVRVQAADPGGSYSGTVEISNVIAGDVVTFDGLVGGKVAEALTSVSAVLDNITRTGSKQTLDLHGGGKIVFDGNADLTKVTFTFLPDTGPIIPNGL